MEDLAGRTALITGANTGIGRATATELARRGAQVYIASRSRPKGEEAAAAIKKATGNDAVGLLSLDLADLASVRSCATTFLGLGQPLHILINNAGLAGKRGLTRDGFELMFGVNYLGHFALTKALLECLEASAPSRVVNLAGGAHFSAKGVDFVAVRQRTHSLTASREYAVAKLCAVLFSQELARHEKSRGVTAYAVHPGVVASDIWRSLPWPVRQLVTMRNALGRAWRTHLGVLRYLTRRGGRQRRLLRGLPPARAEQGGHRGVGPNPMGAQRGLDHSLTALPESHAEHHGTDV